MEYMTVCDGRGGLGHTVTTSSALASPNRVGRVILRAENYVICQELCVSKISCSSPAEADLVDFSLFDLRNGSNTIERIFL